MLNRKEKQDAYELWRECFGDSEEYMDYYFDYKLRDNKVLTSYDQEVLSSMVHLNPYHIVMRNQSISMDYIVGVATKPEYRKQGLMRKLLAEAMEDMYREKKPFTYLMPAKEAIYLPFDFRYVYAQKRYVYTKCNKKQNGEYSNHRVDTPLNRIRKIEDTDKYRESQLTIEDYNTDRAEYFKLVDFTNKKLSKEFDIFVQRDRFYYERLDAEMKAAGGAVKLILNENKLTGYFAYMQEGTESEIVECIVDSVNIPIIIEHIVESVSSQMPALQVAELKEQPDSEDQKVQVTFLESHYLNQGNALLKMEEDGQCIINGMIYSVSSIVKPIIMARIIHFKQFAECLRAEEDISLTIEVEDRFLEANNRVFHLVINSNGCQVNILSNEKESSEMRIPIASLTSLLFGYKTIDQLMEEGLICSKETAEKINKMIPLKSMYINEIV